eukprot:67428_1
MTHIVWNNQFRVGDTINIFNTHQTIQQSPFEVHQLNEYVKIFNDKQETSKKKDTTSGGSWHLSYQLSNNTSSFYKFMHLQGDIGASCLMLSADAKINWIKQQIKTGFNLCLSIQTNYNGKSIVNLRNNNVLKLNKQLKDDILNGTLTIDNFKNKYGTHLIMGTRNGLETNHNVSFTMNEQSDLKIFSLRIYLKIKAFGFTVATKKIYESDKKSFDKKMNISIEYPPPLYLPISITSNENAKSILDSIDNDFQQIT